MSANPRDILIKPVISEKSYSLIDEGKYTFEVAPHANKTEIKIAVQQVFGVKVLSVNTLNRPGKRKRMVFGRNGHTTTIFGHRKETKRAVVTLAQGERIEIFGGPVS
jgi:large subunit ribosomal protein L23